MNHYVILSEGAYSDYSPKYFCGSVPITEKQLKAKGIKVGDAVIAEHGDTAPSYKDREKWLIAMTAWLAAKGFQELPGEIPEINVYYDIPTSKKS